MLITNEDFTRATFKIFSDCEYSKILWKFQRCINFNFVCAEEFLGENGTGSGEVTCNLKAIIRMEEHLAKFAHFSKFKTSVGLYLHSG